MKLSRIVIIGIVSIMITGCLQGQPVHLSLTGLPALLESGTVRSLAREGDSLILTGAGGGGDFRIRVSPWPAPLPLESNREYSLKARTIFSPDGPSSVLEIGDPAGIRLTIGCRVRENAVILPGFRLRLGATRADKPENGRVWVNVVLEKTDGTSLAVITGESVALAAADGDWTLLVTGASIRQPPNASGPKVSVEDPAFIADYILIRNK